MANKSSHILSHFKVAHFRVRGVEYKRTMKFRGNHAYVAFQGIDREIHKAGYRGDFYIYIHGVGHVKIRNISGVKQ